MHTCIRAWSTERTCDNTSILLRLQKLHHVAFRFCVDLYGAPLSLLMPNNQNDEQGSCGQGLDRLTKLIFARAQPKRLGTQIISGSMLAALAEAYVHAINEGAVPTIATAWQVRPLLPLNHC